MKDTTLKTLEEGPRNDLQKLRKVMGHSGREQLLDTEQEKSRILWASEVVGSLISLRQMPTDVTRLLQSLAALESKGSIHTTSSFVGA
jgi:hypothetical protein